jgi:hypothetical protein
MDVQCQLRPEKLVVFQVAPDQEAPDQEAPDQEAPDHEAPDHEAPDHEALDQLAPDQEAPDHEAPDQEAPDHEAPDQLPPDHEAPDQLPPDQLAPLGALTPLLLFVRALVHVCVGAFDASSRLRATSLGRIFPLPSTRVGVSFRSFASAMNRYFTWSGVSEGSRDSRAAVKPLTTEADCEVPEPRKYRSPTRAVGYF